MIWLRMANQPSAMQLRYFTALNDIANDRTSTIVFPLPMDLLGKITGGARDRADRGAGRRATP